MPEPVNRYKVERSFWRNSGPRRGWLRKKSKIYVFQTIGLYTYREDAEIVFDAALFGPGESVGLIDTLYATVLKAKHG